MAISSGPHSNCSTIGSVSSDSFRSAAVCTIAVAAADAAVAVADTAAVADAAMIAADKTVAVAAVADAVIAAIVVASMVMMVVVAHSDCRPIKHVSGR